MGRRLMIDRDVSLAPFTTLGIGGSANYFAKVGNENEVDEAVRFAKASNLGLFVLGGGSNVLISDSGFSGLTMRVAVTGIETLESDPAGKEVYVTAGAGEDWDRFVAFCVANDLAGVECLSGIPGLVGGTPVQNVGAYGQEVAETIVSVRCYDRTTGTFNLLSNRECGFSYRSSIFNSTDRERYIVVGVTYRLLRGGAAKVAYKDLVEMFDDRRPSLSEVREAVLKIRRKKSMVIDPDDPNSKSVGSFFKNPVISYQELERLKKADVGMPFFEFGEMAKIPAAWLIERAGFNKGYALGGAGISANHTLALINRGGATAAEILALKDQIQKAVHSKFGILLQPEPIYIA